MINGQDYEALSNGVIRATATDKNSMLNCQLVLNEIEVLRGQM